VRLKHWNGSILSAFWKRLSCIAMSFKMRNAQVPASICAALLFGIVLLTPRQMLAQRPLGIDVFDGDGAITWSNVQSSGIQFAWTRCTAGATGPSTTFAYNETNAMAAGVLIGAYHYARYDLDTNISGADSEATYFWNNARLYLSGGNGCLMPMLDLEVTNTSAYTKTTFSQWVNRWCQDIVNLGASNGMILRPVIYTYIPFASNNLDNTVANWPLWMVDLNTGKDPQTGAPTVTSPWSNWFVWQYNWTNIVPGVPGTGGECDVDVFNGNLAQMRSSLVIGLITNEPANLTVWQGSNATFTVGIPNSPAATHYQWMFNGTNISGATTSKLIIPNAQITNAGAYSVYITNSSGPTDTSTPAFLSVLPPLTNAPGSILAPANMVDWWPADGNCNDIFGTLNGTPQGGFSYVAGKSAEAFHFDGSTACINTGGRDISPPWTACMWVNYSHTSQTSAGLLEDGTYSLKLEQTGSSTHNVGISQVGYSDSIFNYATPTGTWVHLAFVASTSSVTLYANGVNKGSITTNNMPLPCAYIGAGYANSSARYIDFMLGSIDDLMIFNRALTSTEINSIYNAGSAGFIRAPQVTSVQAGTNSQFTINLKGFTGKNYTVYSSTNLITWTNVATLANASGTNACTVSNITSQPQNFYRVSQPY
jgi:GH25 family lysozyme M1 (1,4-beta-N-acetylmuramidase)